jgi:plasmid maintenance system killer protein
VKIGFRKASEQALFGSSAQLRRKYGPGCAKKIALRLAQIDASANLGVLCQLPQARCHQLVADRSEQFSLDLEHPLRMIVEVADVPIPRTEDGGINRAQVTRLAFVEITDTH